jgi:hypothetical protein
MCLCSFYVFCNDSLTVFDFYIYFKSRDCKSKRMYSCFWCFSLWKIWPYYYFILYFFLPFLNFNMTENHILLIFRTWMQVKKFVKSLFSTLILERFFYIEFQIFVIFWVYEIMLLPYSPRSPLTVRWHISHDFSLCHCIPDSDSVILIDFLSVLWCLYFLLTYLRVCCFSFQLCVFSIWFSISIRSFRLL